MLKILQARLQLSVNQELPDIQAGFRKGRGTRDQTDYIHWIIEKTREFQKTSASLTTSKPLFRSQETVENSSRDGNIIPPYLPLEKPVCRPRSNRTGHETKGLVQNWERSMSRLYIVTLLI